MPNEDENHSLRKYSTIGTLGSYITTFVSNNNLRIKNWKHKFGPILNSKDSSDFVDFRKNQEIRRSSRNSWSYSSYSKMKKKDKTYSNHINIPRHRLIKRNTQR